MKNKGSHKGSFLGKDATNHGMSLSHPLAFITLYLAPTHTYTWRGETPLQERKREK
jgi:hypothetical protein